MTNSTVSIVPESVIWAGKKGKLKVRFPKITDADLRFTRGNKNETIATLASKLGKTKSEMIEIIESL